MKDRPARTSSKGWFCVSLHCSITFFKSKGKMAEMAHCSGVSFVTLCLRHLVQEAEAAVALINCLVLSTNDWLPLREASSSLTADLTDDLTRSSRLRATAFVAMWAKSVPKMHFVEIRRLYGICWQHLWLCWSNFWPLECDTRYSFESLESVWFIVVEPWFFRLWHCLLKFGWMHCWCWKWCMW